LNYAYPDPEYNWGILQGIAGQPQFNASIEHIKSQNKQAIIENI